MNWTFAQDLLTSNGDFLLLLWEFSFISICLQGPAQCLTQWAAAEPSVVIGQWLLKCLIVGLYAISLWFMCWTWLRTPSYSSVPMKARRIPASMQGQLWLSYITVSSGRSGLGLLAWELCVPWVAWWHLCALHARMQGFLDWSTVPPALHDLQ